MKAGENKREYLKQYQPTGGSGKESTFDIHLPLNDRRDPYGSSEGSNNEFVRHVQLGIESERHQNGGCRAGGNAPPEIQSGGGTILLAEDDPAVRCFLLEILRMEGYVVIEAADGEEAVSAFLANQDAIDLVVLDAVMPRKNGMEVYEEIKVTCPGTRVLLMSGYTEDVIFNKGAKDKAIDFISKPLLPEDLLRRVTDILNKR